MQTEKLHTLIVRKVDKSTKNWLKKQAGINKRSVNSEILIAINQYRESKTVTDKDFKK